MECSRDDDEYGLAITVWGCRIFALGYVHHFPITNTINPLPSVIMLSERERMVSEMIMMISTN